MNGPIRDLFDRPLRSLRVSVTDRCNMRCRYCMPQAEYIWLPRESILTFEEIDRLVDNLATLGVSKLRLTGGEPLLRHDLPSSSRSSGVTSRLLISRSRRTGFSLAARRQRCDRPGSTGLR